METIDDIVKWLRNGCGEFAAEIAIQKINNPHYDAEACMDRALGVLADRIEKAENHGYHAIQVHLKKLEGEYENELAEKSRIIAELNEVRELNRECCDENDRLHAALKKVLDVYITKPSGEDCSEGDFMTSSEFGVCDGDGYELDWESVADALSAVSEAQRIWKGGETK